MDVVAIGIKYGKPDFFITMTCDPNWPEILTHLRQFELPQDRLDIVERI
jgi:hypothetical protein